VSYLIDTNVLSELRRRAPDPKVVSWFSRRQSSLLFISVLTLGEIRKGVNLLENSHRRALINEWLETELPRFFAHRILTIDTPVAQRWGQLLASAGRPLPAIDSLLAATALTHGLTLVTRNVQDFQIPGLDVINPWA
jgi:toxin FitB